MDKQQWLEARQKGIGGSDMPVVMGVSPFKTRHELWMEKTGAVFDIPETPAMKRGKVLEPVAANLYSEATGRKLRNLQGPIHHKELGFMLVDIDRHIVATDPDAGPGVLEVKCPGLQVFTKCKREGLPDYYVIQLQHGLEVMGWNWGSFCVFNAERWEMLHFDMERDQELINIIRLSGLRFWELVENKTPPEEDDVLEIDMPKVGGELVKVPDHNIDWFNAVNELKEATEIFNQAEALKDSCKIKIQELMEFYEADIAEGAGARIYWKYQDGRKMIDAKKLKAEKPDIYNEYLKTAKASRPFKPFFLNQTIQE